MVELGFKSRFSDSKSLNLWGTFLSSKRQIIYIDYSFFKPGLYKAEQYDFNNDKSVLCIISTDSISISLTKDNGFWLGNYLHRLHKGKLKGGFSGAKGDGQTYLCDTGRTFPQERGRRLEMGGQRKEMKWGTGERSKTRTWYTVNRPVKFPKSKAVQVILERRCL